MTRTATIQLLETVSFFTGVAELMLGLLCLTVPSQDEKPLPPPASLSNNTIIICTTIPFIQTVETNQLLCTMYFCHDSFLKARLTWCTPALTSPHIYLCLTACLTPYTLLMCQPTSVVGDAGLTLRVVLHLPKIHNKYVSVCLLYEIRCHSGALGTAYGDYIRKGVGEWLGSEGILG